MRQTFALAVLALLTACGRAADRGDTSTVRIDTGGMAAMSDTSGMAGMMSGGMMDSMAAHMRSMETTGATSIEAMVPMHRQMAANLVAQMNREMSAMNMPANATWTALVDSVRQDLVRMPELNAQQMKTFMPAHHGRLTRLMERHREMMKGMKM